MNICKDQDKQSEDSILNTVSKNESLDIRDFALKYMLEKVQQINQKKANMHREKYGVVRYNDDDHDHDYNEQEISSKTQKKNTKITTKRNKSIKKTTLSQSFVLKCIYSLIGISCTYIGISIYYNFHNIKKEIVNFESSQPIKSFQSIDLLNYVNPFNYQVVDNLEKIKKESTENNKVIIKIMNSCKININIDNFKILEYFTDIKSIKPCNIKNIIDFFEEYKKNNSPKAKNFCTNFINPLLQAPSTSKIQFNDFNESLYGLFNNVILNNYSSMLQEILDHENDNTVKIILNYLCKINSQGVNSEKITFYLHLISSLSNADIEKVLRPGSLKHSTSEYPSFIATVNDKFLYDFIFNCYFQHINNPNTQQFRKSNKHNKITANKQDLCFLLHHLCYVFLNNIDAQSASQYKQFNDSEAVKVGYHYFVNTILKQTIVGFKNGQKYINYDQDCKVIVDILNKNFNNANNIEPDDLLKQRMASMCKLSCVKHYINESINCYNTCKDHQKVLFKAGIGELIFCVSVMVKDIYHTGLNKQSIETLKEMGLISNNNGNIELDWNALESCTSSASN